VLSRQCLRHLSHYIMKILCTQVHSEEALLACCETVKTDRTIDIKPNNLLVKNGSQNTHYKVCDLGNSASLNVLSNNKEHLISTEICELICRKLSLSYLFMLCRVYIENDD